MQRTRQSGEALFEFYVGSLFRHGLYNWDPHPGNYVFQQDGRVAMLDYGSTREFDRAFVRKLTALTDAVHRDTRDALHEALMGLGMVREGDRAIWQVASARVYDGGADGDGDTTPDNTLFATEGVFVP